MTERPAIAPFGHYLPSAESLGIAARFADPTHGFDATAVEEEARRLHALYFDEIAGALGFAPSEPFRFLDGAFHKANAFATRDGVGTVIAFDSLLDFILFGLSHLVTVLALEDLDDETHERVVENAIAHASLARDPLLHEEVRAAFLPLAIRFEASLNVSFAIARSMVVFVLCHEIGHVRLRHVGEQPGPALEHAADAFAAESFLRLVGDRRLARTYIDPKVAFAPMAFYDVLEIVSAGRRRRTGSVHPSAAERRERVGAILRPTLRPEAASLHEGFAHAAAYLAERCGAAAVAAR